MRIKPRVRIHGVRPEIAFVMPIIERVFHEAMEELVITSVIEGKHSRGSLHYVGAAIDIRTRDMSGTVIADIITALHDCLGDDFDTVRETTHIHVEFQPKAPY